MGSLNNEVAPRAATVSQQGLCSCWPTYPRLLPVCHAGTHYTWYKHVFLPQPGIRFLVLMLPYAFAHRYLHSTQYVGLQRKSRRLASSSDSSVPCDCNHDDNAASCLGGVGDLLAQQHP